MPTVRNWCAKQELMVQSCCTRPSIAALEARPFTVASHTTFRNKHKRFYSSFPWLIIIVLLPLTMTASVASWANFAEGHKDKGEDFKYYSEEEEDAHDESRDDFSSPFPSDSFIRAMLDPTSSSCLASNNSWGENDDIGDDSSFLRTFHGEDDEKSWNLEEGRDQWHTFLPADDSSYNTTLSTEEASPGFSTAAIRPLHRDPKLKHRTAGRFSLPTVPPPRISKAMASTPLNKVMPTKNDRRTPTIAEEKEHEYHNDEADEDQGISYLYRHQHEFGHSSPAAKIRSNLPRFFCHKQQQCLRTHFSTTAMESKMGLLEAKSPPMRLGVISPRTLSKQEEDSYGPIDDCEEGTRSCCSASWAPFVTNLFPEEQSVERYLAGTKQPYTAVVEEDETSSPATKGSCRSMPAILSTKTRPSSLIGCTIDSKLAHFFSFRSSPQKYKQQGNKKRLSSKRNHLQHDQNRNHSSRSSCCSSRYDSFPQRLQPSSTTCQRGRPKNLIENGCDHQNMQAHSLQNEKEVSCNHGSDHSGLCADDNKDEWIDQSNGGDCDRSLISVASEPPPASKKSSLSLLPSSSQAQTQSSLLNSKSQHRLELGTTRKQNENNPGVALASRNDIENGHTTDPSRIRKTESSSSTTTTATTKKHSNVVPVKTLQKDEKTGRERLDKKKKKKQHLTSRGVRSFGRGKPGSSWRKIVNSTRK